MADWGVCCTLKAPVDQMLAFVAHHHALGAAHLWLHFDDPDDPAHAVAQRLPDVTAIRCDRDWWQQISGGRPGKHQVRQSSNIAALYAKAPLPWLLHADVDEFLLADSPMPTLLDAVSPSAPFIRARPWEALHEPDLPDDIQTASHFRAALPGARNAGNRELVFGQFAALLPNGALSHAAGKCLFRTGIDGLIPRIHGAFRDGQRVEAGDFHPALALLHFHAQDRTAWFARLAFRLRRGAYQFNPPMADFLASATQDQLDEFYVAVQSARPETLAKLAQIGALRAERLDLRAKVAALTRGNR